MGVLEEVLERFDQLVGITEKLKKKIETLEARIAALENGDRFTHDITYGRSSNAMPKP